MKKKIISIYFVCCIAAFTVNSCSDEKVENNTIETIDNSEETQMKELIQYVRDLRPSPIDTQTRGWWQSLTSWFSRVAVADAGGYGWAESRGASISQRLRISATSSLTSAITKTGEVQFMWLINNAWKVFPLASREHQEIGNRHNQIIYELDRENPTLKNGTFTSSSILSMVNTKAKAMGYNEDLTPLQRATLMVMLEEIKTAKSASSVVNVFLKENPSCKLECQFVQEYLNSVLLLETREETISFTEQMFTKIDSMSGVKKTD